jgi:hypothetical protein
MFMISAIVPNEETQALPSAGMPTAPVWTSVPHSVAQEDIPLDELRLRRLVGDEIEQIVPMRSQIDLAAAMLADPEFALHEKKKTGSAWFSRSRLKTGSSAPFA